MIPVTKPSLPNLDRVRHYLERAHARSWLTNFGPLHDELTERLKDFLKVEHLLLVSNGTIALQVAYRALNLTGPVLTTPFSFIATTSSLAWENLEPCFVDIDRETLNIYPVGLESAAEAGAILAVHVYGNPCEVDRIQSIAATRGIPVIYDAAHAFASQVNGESVLRWGDASTLSFHATKIFHTVEGGAIVFRDPSHLEAARALINFGQQPDGAIRAVGVNGKLSEYHAAAGLALLDSIETIITARYDLVDAYRTSLDGWVDFQRWHDRSTIVGAYMPILLAGEGACLSLKATLGDEGIQTRRYFHPSLNTIDLGRPRSDCPVSEDIAARVLCLPLYDDLAVDEVRTIAERVKAALS